jgi:hypothetical protein
MSDSGGRGRGDACVSDYYRQLAVGTMHKIIMRRSMLLLPLAGFLRR